MITLSAAFPNSDARNQALTTRQREVLRFVQAFTSRHGYAPTIREIRAGIRVESLNSVTCHLAALKRKGYLARGKNKQRSIVVLKNPDGSPPKCCPTCRRSL